MPLFVLRFRDRAIAGVAKSSHSPAEEDSGRPRERLRADAEWPWLSERRALTEAISDGGNDDEDALGEGGLRIIGVGGGRTGALEAAAVGSGKMRKDSVFVDLVGGCRRDVTASLPWEETPNSSIKDSVGGGSRCLV